MLYSTIICPITAHYIPDIIHSPGLTTPPGTGHVTAAVLEDPRAAGGHLTTVHVVHGTLVEGTGHHHVVHLLQVHLVGSAKRLHNEMG